METFGEDPYLLALSGVAYTSGLQQESANPKYLKVRSAAMPIPASFLLHVHVHVLKYSTRVSCWRKLQGFVFQAVI